MITIEQIDEFRKRTHSSYEDAKYYLEKNNGEILDAIIDFEKTRTGKTYNYQKKQHDEYGKRFADILQKGFDTRVCIEDKGQTLFTIPVILLILLIPLWIIVLLLFVFLMMLGYKFSIRDVKNPNFNVSSLFQNINDKMKESNVTKEKDQPKANHSEPFKPTQPTGSQVPVPSNITPPAAPNAPEQPKEPDHEEGYKEYTIE